MIRSLSPLLYTFAVSQVLIPSCKVSNKRRRKEGKGQLKGKKQNGKEVATHLVCELEVLDALLLLEDPVCQDEDQHRRQSREKERRRTGPALVSVRHAAEYDLREAKVVNSVHSRGRQSFKERKEGSSPAVSSRKSCRARRSAPTRRGRRD
jgi:hypothetical protein